MKSLFPKAHVGLQTIFDGKFTHHQFLFDRKEMPDCKEYERNNRKSGYLKEFFTKLDDITAPVIYWFEAKNGDEAKKQLELISVFIKEQKTVNKETRRVTPPPNHNAKVGGNVLYVGKRQEGSKNGGFTNIADRMEIHLGYNPVGKNPGLQLVHWSNGQFTINILELNSGVEPSYLSILEQLFAIEFSPLLGKH